jgi:inner membrane protein
MDNLTHTLTGLAMSRGGLDRGHRGTAAMIMLAANAPDIDAYPFFTDAVEYIDIHRGYTHGLAFAPLVALLPIAIVCGILRMRPKTGVLLWQWFACTFAVLSHIAWDWTNVYGVRMLLPFSDRWVRLDITDIVDPIVWALLIVCTALPSILKLVGSEIGARKATGGKMGWAWAALLGLLAYEGTRWVSHERVVERMSDLLYMGAPAKNIYAFPIGASAVRWRGLVEGENFYYEFPVQWSGEFNMQDAALAYKPPVTAEIAAARKTRTFRVFGSFNQVQLWETSPTKDATLVSLFDLRFGSLARHGFAATAIVGPGGRIEEERFRFGR